MEKGSKALARMIGISFVLGVAVLALHPGYRRTAVALWKGAADSSPVAVSNRDYYPEITLEKRAAPDEK